MSSSQPRIKICCPSCQKDGSARAELLNRRVACKHCSHVFRVIPVEGEAPTQPAGMSVSSASAILPTSPAFDTLRLDLEKARKAQRKAEAAEAAIRLELDQLREQLEQTIENTGDNAPSTRFEEELRFLRDQLDKARADADAETKKRRESAATLAARTTEHAEALKLVRKKLEDARAEARTIEERRQAEEKARSEFEARTTTEIQALRDELERANAQQIEAKQAIEAVGAQRDRAIAEQTQAIDVSKSQIIQLEARLVEAEATRIHRDQLAREIELLQTRLVEAETLANEHKQGLEALRLDRDQAETTRTAELAELRDQLDKARAGSADAAILRQELDEVRADRDRMVAEIETLHVRIADAERRESDQGFLSTEIDLPQMSDAVEAPTGQTEPSDDHSTIFDPWSDKPPGEPDASLQEELAELTHRLEEKEAELAELIDRSKNEMKELRRALYDARLAVETTSNDSLELGRRVRELEDQLANQVAEPVEPAIDQAAIEAERAQAIELERNRAVELAVKGAWADFERRLAETHQKLQAANARADMMETEAREAREQILGKERALELVGDGSSFGGEASSITSLRILEARGTSRLTLADAEARLALARQLAVERKDKPLIDRIGKMTQKVKADLEARNYTLAETLVRGAEIETGIDPGGFSINGQRIFRASPTIVGSLAALAPAYDRVMRTGELETILSTIDEVKTILGDQAGLPEIRRPGRFPTLRPIARPEAFRLLIDALIAESWLIRPVVQKKPLPDTSLGTYASIVEAACIARKVAEEIDREQVSFLDEIIQACCLMLTRRQQADGHFAFLDPRGKPSKAATMVEGMIAQRSDAVKDGWVIHVDPLGLAQIETSPCAVALATASQVLKRDEWARASQKAVEWAVGQPCLPRFAANAASIGLLARSYLDTEEDPDLVGLVRKLTVGLLPGQVDNGRWVDPESATTADHLVILRALHDAWEAIPTSRQEIREPLKKSLDRAMASLLEECKAIGTPPQGAAFRVLLRHRDLFADDRDPRLEFALLESAAVIQELCHDGHRPRLGVAADQLASLMLL